MKALQERWGDQTGAKIQLAKGMIAAAEKQWPGLTNYLNATGLGSDPKTHPTVGRAGRAPAGSSVRRIHMSVLDRMNLFSNDQVITGSTASTDTLDMRADGVDTPRRRRASLGLLLA